MLLGAAVGGAVAAALAPFPRLRAAEAPTVTPITDRIALLSGVGGNVVVRSSAGGQLLVDTGSAEHGEALVRALAELPGAGRVEKLFNTHWHLEQVGSNAVFGRSGATIVAHEKTRLRLSTDVYVPEEDRYRKAMPSDAHPTESFYTEDATTFDGERIEYGYLLEAHTDGDIYVYFRDANVIAVGDAVSPVRDPELDWFGGGWLGGRVDSLARLLEITNAETRVVPSSGPVVGREEIAAEHDLMTKLFDRTTQLLRQGYSAEDMLAAGALDDLGRTFADPAKLIYAIHKSLWAHHNTISHDIV